MSAPYLKQQLARDAMQIYSITVAVAEGADLSCPRRRPKFLCVHSSLDLTHKSNYKVGTCEH